MTKTSAGILAGSLLMGGLALAACAANTGTSNQARAERGKYLVTIGSCNDCHTPLKMGPNGPEHDSTQMLSGHPESFAIDAPVAQVSDQWLMTAAATSTAFSGPWGVSFAANLTPDENTGLGIWTEDMFVKALRTGRHMGASREILPPMPWNYIGQMTDDDLKAVYAYLRTIPPVSNHVPVPLPPAPQQVAKRTPDAAAMGDAR